MPVEGVRRYEMARLGVPLVGGYFNVRGTEPPPVAKR